jgi:hypothetical protein
VPKATVFWVVASALCGSEGSGRTRRAYPLGRRVGVGFDVSVCVGFDVSVGVDVVVGAFARNKGTILSAGNYSKEEEGEPR